MQSVVYFDLCPSGYFNLCLTSAFKLVCFLHKFYSLDLEITTEKEKKENRYICIHSLQRQQISAHAIPSWQLIEEKFSDFLHKVYKKVKTQPANLILQYIRMTFSPPMLLTSWWSLVKWSVLALKASLDFLPGIFVTPFANKNTKLMFFLFDVVWNVYKITDS